MVHRCAPKRLGPMEDRLFASVFVGSGLLFVASLFGSAAFADAMVETVATDSARFLDSGLYHLARNLVSAFLNVFAIKMAGVFIMSSSMIAFRTAILPRWVTILGFACAIVLLLVITRWQWIALLFPCWMLVVSVSILLAEFHPSAGDSGSEPT